MIDQVPGLDQANTQAVEKLIQTKQCLLPDPREICKNTVPGMGGKKPYRTNSGHGELYMGDPARLHLENFSCTLSHED